LIPVTGNSQVLGFGEDYQSVGKTGFVSVQLSAFRGQLFLIKTTIFINTVIQALSTRF
jgi:hypothetical protein